MKPRLREIAFFAALAAATTLPLRAHGDGKSRSVWNVDGTTVHASFTMPLRVVHGFAPLLLRKGATLHEGFLVEISQNISLHAGGLPCRPSAPRLFRGGGLLRASWRAECPGTGELKLRIRAFFEEGPAHQHVARMRFEDGEMAERLFRAGMQEWTVAREKGVARKDYFFFGISHIASGSDHLAFLLSLLLLRKGVRGTLVLVTGFTVGHGLSVALTLTRLSLPEGPQLEALIGLSIAWAAAESVLEDRKRLSLAIPAGIFLVGLLNQGVNAGLPPLTLAGLALFSFCFLRAPDKELQVLVVGLFGLIHGLGFASGLSRAGLPDDRLLHALFFFNAGVEFGQLLFVGSAGAILLLATKMAPSLRQPAAREAAAALLVCAGVFWFVTRSYG